MFNNVAQNYGRDPLGRMSRRVVYSSGQGNISVEHYGYDAMSRLSSTYREEDGLSDNFGYDASGQLNSANYRNSARWVGYSWDNAGNRTQVNDTGWAYGYGVNSLNQYGWTGDGGGVGNGDVHEINYYNGVSYGYRDDSHWNHAVSASNDYYIYYDGLGRTVQRNLNGVTTYYIYDGEKPIYEYKADGSTAGWNVYGKGIDEPLLRADYVAAPGGQGYFFQQDHEGSVTHLTGWGGEVIESYRYDAFGAPTTTHSGGNFNNRFKFTGREYVPQFGFYEYRNRAYHPGLGRFMSEDPSGFAAGDYNLFRYCGNDPVDRIDPMGLFSTSALTSHGGGDWVFDSRNISYWEEFMHRSAAAQQMVVDQGTALKNDFYQKGYGKRFDQAFRRRAGYVLDIPEQTLANSPEVVTGYTEDQLGKMNRGSGMDKWPTALNRPWEGRNGTIYISNEALRNRRDPHFAFRSYAHELANIVDARMYQTTAASDKMHERHFGIRNNPPTGDHDTGMAVELEMFGDRIH